jgi:hypothetical protein
VSALPGLVEAYLDRLGQSPGRMPSLGETAPSATPEDTRFIEGTLRAQRTFNDRIILVAILLLCAFFALGVFLILRFLSSPATIPLVFGGTIFSLLGIVRWLQTLWWDKSMMDVLLAVCASMTPDEAARTITTVYFEVLKSRSKKSRPQARRAQSPKASRGA